MPKTEHQLQYNRKYYKLNTDIINQKQNTICECECGNTYTSRHKTRHMRSRKHNKRMDQLPNQ